MPLIARGPFGFAESVRNAFGFVRGFGFVEKRATETLVEFLSERVFLNVYHGRSSFELGVEIGWRGQVKGYSMSALIRASDPERAKEFRNKVVAEPKEMPAGVEHLAGLLQKYGDGALRGEDAFFERLAAEEREWAEVLAAEVAYDQNAARAAEAFRTGDYALAVDLYRPIEASLTPAERAKLAYARRKS